MSAKWIDAEDKLLRQLTSIGLNAKQIHSTYSTLLQGRSVKAIEQRLCYLNKPAEQRRQDDMASMDDVDRGNRQCQRPHLQPSGQYRSVTGSSEPDHGRTCTGYCFIKRDHAGLPGYQKSQYRDTRLCEHN